MKRSLSIIAILAFMAASCQQSTDPAQLREKVMASSEFAALAEAYENRGIDLMNEKQQESQELASLSAEERQARQEEIARMQEAEKEQKKLLEERNRQIRALLSGEEKPDKAEFEAAVRKIDQSLGITTEMATPSKTFRMRDALAALMEEFPEIREMNADFVKECLSAYRQQKDGQGTTE